MSKFKVGDRVRIARKVEKEDGWENCWAGHMDKLIGSIGRVESQGLFGVHLEGIEGDYFGWPPSSLELASDKPDGWDGVGEEEQEYLEEELSETAEQEFIHGSLIDELAEVACRHGIRIEYNIDTGLVTLHG